MVRLVSPLVAILRKKRTDQEYYPWGGEFTRCSPQGCVAVVLLTTNYIPPKNVALYGPLKTENIGIEKIIANVISNPHIRYLVVCGDDIRGHRSGSSILALHKNGIDKNHRIIDAPGAIPFIENLKKEAITRFQQQIQTLNLLEEKDTHLIDTQINKLIEQNPPSFGKPYIAIRIQSIQQVNFEDKRALHSKIIVDYLGKIKKRGI
jgi:tetrahydromethanopterin S-methyltransferase subunit A